jgi:hypothetical protein
MNTTTTTAFADKSGVGSGLPGSGFFSGIGNALKKGSAALLGQGNTKPNMGSTIITSSGQNASPFLPQTTSGGRRRRGSHKKRTAHKKRTHRRSHKKQSRRKSRRSRK